MWGERVVDHHLGGRLFTQESFGRKAMLRERVKDHHLGGGLFTRRVLEEKSCARTVMDHRLEGWVELGVQNRGALSGRIETTYVSKFHFLSVIHVINTQTALVDEKEQSGVWCDNQGSCGG